MGVIGNGLGAIVGVIFGWGWLIVVVLLLWIAWKVYLYLKKVEYLTGIQWTFVQITLPDDAEQTPKAMENAFAVWDGIHKNPDLIERYFEGYIMAWYSCELHCTKGRARYIMVIPTIHRTFFEGVIYGQYPKAEVTEVDDYTQRYSWEGIDKTFDLYGTEITLTDDDILPIKTYRDYEDVFAEDDKFIDPHQALVEAYTNIQEGEEFWLQILVRPIAGSEIKKWEQRGENEIDELAGKEAKVKRGLLSGAFDSTLAFSGEVVRAGLQGPTEGGNKSGGGGVDFPKVSASDTAKMDGILRKISQGGYRTKIRILYLAPLGKLTKPNIGRAIGGFKQFSSYHLNQMSPDSSTKTNSPNYFYKQSRRYRKKREIFLLYQWRDFFGEEDGYMMSDEELATLYHFPTKYTRAPAVERGQAGLGSAPDNVPYA